MEQTLNQKLVNDWYTVVLIRVTGSHDKETMAAYASENKVRMKIINPDIGTRIPMLTVVDRKNRILGQLPVKYFIKK